MLGIVDCWRSSSKTKSPFILGHATYQGKEEVNYDEIYYHGISACVIDKVNSDDIPHMLRWVCQQSPKFHTVQSQVFDLSVLIIKAVIEMTFEEEQLRISSGELFDKTHPCNIVHTKNGGLKRVGEVSDDGGDFKMSKKQKLKCKMKEALRNLKDRVAVVENKVASLKSDIAKLKGMMSTILKHMKFEKKLRMLKEDDSNNETKVDDKHKMNALGSEVYIELEKPIDVLEKKFQIGLEKQIDVVDDEV
ncbi:uncharacterized protein E5676_scaffold216G001640 [Cucumis melo var. makuwa]|uniref:Ulp1-like peptidase n=1 Tax=Cucumis melo var. makuwa TaxID=1194695 RepID=A0A5D3E2R6_CUCMM|nr:uncharacterized protein E5676_scaffold216G001640 [Cucumis melo var. makuwa]